MSRGIVVNVSPAKIFANPSLTEEQRVLLPLFREALAESHVNPQEDSIYVQPGSHPGIEAVRLVWARSKGYKTLRKVPADVFEENHLLNHGAEEGDYLPQDFKRPRWKGENSIGSSPRLLRVLLEIDPTMLQEEERRPYFAFLAAALGSVLGNAPMSLF